MSQDLELQQLGDGPRGNEPRPERPDGDLRRLAAVPVDVSVELGRTRMTVGETLALREGSVITLDRLAGEPVDLLVNGTTIGRGEVVVIDEQFGLRLTAVLTETTSEVRNGAGVHGSGAQVPASPPPVPGPPAPAES